MSTTVLGQGMPKVRKNEYAAYFEKSQENHKKMEAKTAQTKRDIEQYDTLYLQGAMSKEEHEAAVSQAKKEEFLHNGFLWLKGLADMPTKTPPFNPNCEMNLYA